MRLAAALVLLALAAAAAPASAHTRITTAAAKAVAPKKGGAKKLVPAKKSELLWPFCTGPVSPALCLEERLSAAMLDGL